MQQILPIIITALGILVFFITVYFIIIALFFHKEKQGQALVRTGLGGTKVAINGGIYSIPIFHQLETIDISMKKIQIDCLSKESAISKDNLRTDVKAVFLIRVKYEVESIAKVALTIGAGKIRNTESLKDMFQAKFSEALKSTIRKFEFTELLDNRKELCNQTLILIGTDLHGFTIEDCAIDYIEKSNTNK
ncbi:SPFH domain/Band 7 family protein [Nonlabens xylanidelens]|uniref:SPFH domain/Band 7 family protein n=1 Tax=Nonlabens xylanidelens TaxID=191564 RepID=A0A2S6IRC2_9FLAO|nr:SPFH domain-containing protein [Nonlabens xylanidelens]PPK96721.1 SPFH domain/Band 7 family protein [Nonlabens xylanidelens]PQJ13433.1 hypothetical protein BST94_13800 [Nonlabens xylanidelens]